MEYEIDKQSKNEHGNPIYPKWVNPKDGGEPVRVNNIEHEVEVTGIQPGGIAPEKEPKKEETKKDETKPKPVGGWGNVA